MQESTRKFSPLSGGIFVAFMITLSTVGSRVIGRVVAHAQEVGYFENRQHERFLKGTPDFDHWLMAYQGASWVLIGLAVAAAIVVMRDLAKADE